MFPLQKKLRGLRSKTTHHLSNIRQCEASILSFASHPLVFSFLNTYVCYLEAGAKVTHSPAFKGNLENWKHCCATERMTWQKMLCQHESCCFPRKGLLPCTGHVPDHFSLKFKILSCKPYADSVTFGITEWKEDSVQLSQQKLNDQAPKVVTLCSPQYALTVHRQLVGHMVPVSFPCF